MIIMKYKTLPKTPLPRVNECIAYLNSLGWRTVLRKQGSYAFVKDGAPAHLMPMWFNLGELRDAFKYGF